MNKTKAIPGPFKEVVEGPTPHGGSFTVTYYFDSHYRPVIREKATRAIVHEYDDKSRSIFRDYLTLDRGQPIIRRREAPVAEPSDAPVMPQDE